MRVKSNIQLKKLRMHLFDGGKVLFTALIGSMSFLGFHIKLSALSFEISSSSKSSCS